MKAVILAAGIGNRLVEIGRKTPKCLLEIGSHTLLERHIEILNSCGISLDDIIVVIGGKGEVWSEENQERVKKIHKHVVINDQNIEKGSSYSFWLAIKDLKNESVLRLDGDLLVSKGILEKVVKSELSSVIASIEGSDLTTYKKSRDYIKIKNGKVIEVGKNIISQKIFLPVLKLNSDMIELLKKEMRSGTYFNGSIDILINKLCKNNDIYNINIATKESKLHFFACNINTMEDYKRANEYRMAKE